MGARGVGKASPLSGAAAPGLGPSPPPKGVVRLRPETWRLLASLRRQIVDSEGKSVGVESFDRLVRRLIEENLRSAPRLTPDGRRGGA